MTAVPTAGVQVSSSRIRNFTGLRRRFGWKQSLGNLALWVLRQAFGYRSATIYRLNLDHLQKALPPPAQPLDWGYKGSGEILPDLWEAAEIAAPESKPVTGLRFFVGAVRGNQCYLSLVSQRGFTIPGRLTIAFASPAEAYVGNCITRSDFRGLGIYHRGLVELGCQLQTEGKRWLYLFVERDNLASIHGVKKAGFQAVAQASVWQWRKRSVHRWKLIHGQTDMECIRQWSLTPDE